MDALDNVVKDIFVSLRMGDTQKQSRLVASRNFKFEPVAWDNKGPFARIEVFKRIGTSTVSFDDGCSGEVQDVDVNCLDQDMQHLRLRLAVQNSGAGPALKEFQPSVKQKAKNRMDFAKQYLDKHNLEESIALAMREVIRQKPDDPHQFLADQLLAMRGNIPNPAPAERMMPPASPSSKKAAPPSTPSAQKAAPPQVATISEKASAPASLSTTRPMSVVPVQEYCRATVCCLASTPSLYAKFPSCRPSESSAKPSVAVEPFQKLPSVGTWLAAPARRMPSVCDNLSLAAEKVTPFEMRPSVGTWLAPTPARKARPATEDSTPAAPHLPLRHLPSAGVWLQKIPFQVERPWYYKSVDALGDAENSGQHICALQSEIEKRDKEIQDMHHMLKQLAEQVGKDTLADMGITGLD